MKTIVVYLQVVCIVFILSNTPMFSQWEQCNGPFGGNVVALEVKNQNIYTIVTAQGVFKSSDNGQSWDERNKGLSLDHKETSIAVSDSIFIVGNWGNGVFISKDEGENWKQSNSGLTNLYVASIAIRGNDIYVGTLDGFFVSPDNGVHWKLAADTGLGDRHVRSLAIRDSTIFAGTNYGLYISTNKGEKWKLSDSGIRVNSTIQSILVSGEDIYVGTYYTGCYISHDNGLSWKSINNGISKINVKGLVAFDSLVFAGTLNGGGVCSKVRLDTTWTQKNNGLFMRDIQCLAVLNEKIYAGTAGGGIFVSKDFGLSWEASNKGIKGSNISCLYVADSILYAGVYGSGVFSSSDNGDNWITKREGLTNPFITCIASNDSNIFVGTSQAGVFLSTDNGKNWKAVNYGLSNNAITSLAIDSNNLFAGCSNVYYDTRPIYLSMDNGTKWIVKSWNIKTDNHGYGIFQNVNCLKFMGNHLYAGTDKGLYVSSNNGSNWSEASSGNILSFAVKDSTLWVGTDNGIYMKKYEQSSWTEPNTDFKNIAIQCIAISNTIIFTGSYNQGIYVSSDNGANWTQKISGLPFLNIQSLVVKDSFIFAGIANGSVFKARISDFIPSSIEGMKIEENNFRVYPNPISNYSTIELIVKYGQNISIIISDVLGREVLDIVKDKYFESGRYVLNIYSENLPIGLYYCNLKSVNYDKTIQIVVQNK